MEYDDGGSRIKEIYLVRKPADVIGRLIQLDQDGQDMRDGKVFSLDGFKKKKISIASPGEIDIPALVAGENETVGWIKGFKEESRVGILGKFGVGRPVGEVKFGVTLSNATFDPVRSDNPNNLAIQVNGHNVDNMGVDLNDGDRIVFSGVGHDSYRYELKQ